MRSRTRPNCQRLPDHGFPICELRGPLRLDAKRRSTTSIFPFVSRQVAKDRQSRKANNEYRSSRFRRSYLVGQVRREITLVLFLQLLFSPILSGDHFATIAGATVTFHFITVVVS